MFPAMNALSCMVHRTGQALLVAIALSATSAWSQAAKTPPPGSKVPEVLAITDALVKAAQKEGRVYIRYSAPQASTEAMFGVFKRKYGIDVVTERKVAAEGTNTFLTEERAGRHIVDVHINTDRRGALALAKDGFYAPYRVSNDAQYDVLAKFQNFAIAPYLTTSVLAYNTDRLSSKDAEALFSGTWTGLLDRRFRNKHIGILSPFITSASSLWFWGLMEHPKYGESFLRAVAAMDPVIYPDQAVGEEALHAGEVDVLVGEVIEPAQMALIRGAPIAWVYPDLLPAVPAVYHFLSSKAPHPNAARLLLAWILSEDGARAISLEGEREPVIKAKIPRNPKVQAALDKAKWFKPFPDKVRFAPVVEEMIDREDGYRKQMAAMFNISVRR